MRLPQAEALGPLELGFQAAELPDMGAGDWQEQFRLLTTELSQQHPQICLRRNTDLEEHGSTKQLLSLHPCPFPGGLVDPACCVVQNHAGCAKQGRVHQV